MLARQGEMRAPAPFTRRDAVRLFIARAAHPGRGRDPRLRHPARAVRRSQIVRRRRDGRHSRAARADLHQRRRRPSRPAKRPARRVAPQYDYTTERAQTIADRAGVTPSNGGVARSTPPFTAVPDDPARSAALRAALPTLTALRRDTLASLDQVAVDGAARRDARVLELDRAARRSATRCWPTCAARLATIRRAFTGATARARGGDPVARSSFANSTYDDAATEAARDARRGQRRRRSVHRCRKGEVLVPRGERIDDLAHEKLDAFGLLDPQPDLAEPAAGSCSRR